MDTSLHLYKAEHSEPVVDKTLYQQLMGCLQYLVTGTRPDLAFSISFPSQFSDHPLEQHHLATKWILRYLSRTKGLLLQYPYGKPAQLVGLSDASYANDLDEWHSYSGYAFFLSGCLISWAAKKQVSTSVLKSSNIRM